MCAALLTCREALLSGNIEELKKVYKRGGLWHKDCLAEFMQINFTCCWHREYYGRNLPNMECFYFAFKNDCPIHLDYLQSGYAKEKVKRQNAIEIYDKCMKYISRKYFIAIKKLFGDVVEGPAILVHSFIVSRSIQ